MKDHSIPVNAEVKLPGQAIMASWTMLFTVMIELPGVFRPGRRAIRQNLKEK